MKKLELLSVGYLSLILMIFSANVEAQTRGDRALIGKAQNISGDRFTYFAETPRGTRIYSVKKPTAKTLHAIDRGLSDLFAISRKNGYTRKLNYTDYTIFIAKADRTRDGDGRYSPAIAVGAAQYAGSTYDKGGYIYAAGMVLGYNPGAFIIAESDGNVQSILDIVRFEGEHIILYHNDRRLYGQTADHSRGGGHPILQ